jgi:hypothetical protein
MARGFGGEGTREKLENQWLNGERMLMLKMDAQFLRITPNTQFHQD